MFLDLFFSLSRLCAQIWPTVGYGFIKHSGAIVGLGGSFHYPKLAFKTEIILYRIIKKPLKQGLS